MEVDLAGFLSYSEMPTLSFAPKDEHVFFFGMNGAGKSLAAAHVASEIESQIHYLQLAIQLSTAPFSQRKN